MKFYCEECGKLYQECKCTLYVSRYRFGRTDPLPPHAKDTKDGQDGVLRSSNGHPDGH